MTAFKQVIEHNRLHIRASAVVGLGGLHRIIYGAVVRLAGRPIRAFDDEESAKRWLLTQA